MSWARGWSSPSEEKPKTEWTPVVNPEPVFSGPDEKRRYEDAIARNPRLPGHDPIAWIERVCAEAKGERAPGVQYRLPYKDAPDPADALDAEKEP